MMPANVGRQMLGVMDETGSLEYGQVFLQYSTEIAYPLVRGSYFLQTILQFSHNPPNPLTTSDEKSF